MNERGGDGSDEFERPAAAIPVPLERDSGR